MFRVLSRGSDTLDVHLPLKAALTVACGVAAVAGEAVAQETESRERPDVVTLEQVTVTARKVEEPVRQIPFGITVFDAESIERDRLQDARSIGRSTPGLNFVDVGARPGNLPNIRGVGSLIPLSGDDTSVPVFVDGVPLPVRAQDLDFVDIQRIEVLRGPQNSVFGRNAQAGAISITTADPTFEPVFEIGGEIGNFEHGRISALASGPLSETLAARLSGRFDTRGGDFADITRNDDVRGKNVTMLNGKVLWVPGDDTDVTLAFRYGNYDEEVFGVLFDDPGFPRQATDIEQRLELETAGAGLTVTHDFADFTLISVTGLQYYQLEQELDSTDGVVFGVIADLPPAVFDDPTVDFRLSAEDDIQVSQEIRLDGELTNGMRWLAGVSFFRADLDFDVAFSGDALDLFGDFEESFVTTSYATFGKVTVPFGDRLRATGGLRFTHEIKDFDGRFTDLSGTAAIPSTSQSDSLTFDLVTGRAALSYDFLPTFTGFASIARGAKAGGFQLLDIDAADGSPTSRFESAFTWSYEAGVRGTLLDGRLDLGASLFFNDTTDEHVQVFDVQSLQFIIENVDVQTYGVELETTARPVDRLALSAGVGLLQTEIVASDDPTIVAGNEAPFSPALTFNAAAQYAHPFDLLERDGELFGRIEYQYTGSRTIDPQNTVDLDPFDLVNLRFGWGSEGVSVYGFVDNLFDETYAETAFSFGTSVTGARVAAASPGLPRRFGVGARLRF